MLSYKKNVKEQTSSKEHNWLSYIYMCNMGTYHALKLLISDCCAWQMPVYLYIPHCPPLHALKKMQYTLM